MPSFFRSSSTSSALRPEGSGAIGKPIRFISCNSSISSFRSRLCTNNSRLFGYIESKKNIYIYDHVSKIHIHKNKCTTYLVFVLLILHVHPPYSTFYPASLIANCVSMPFFVSRKSKEMSVSIMLDISSMLTIK